MSIQSTICPFEPRLCRFIKHLIFADSKYEKYNIEIGSVDKSMRIQKINKRKFRRLWARWEAGKATPNALFYFRDRNKYIAVDNTTGDFYVEEFSSLPLCKQWLQGDFEIIDMKWEEKEYAKSNCDDS